MWGKLATERDTFAIQRRDDGSITVDYGHPDVLFVVRVTQVRRDGSEEAR